MTHIAVVRPGIERRAAESGIELSEDECNYRIVAELPGLQKQDINVRIDGNCVAISTDAQSDGYGGHRHRLVLERAIETRRAYALYRDGRLELLLPKYSPGSGRLIIN